MLKKHVKCILKHIRKAFEISETSEEYEDLCDCIFYSACHLDYEDFERLKKLVC